MRQRRAASTSSSWTAACRSWTALPPRARIRAAEGRRRARSDRCADRPCGRRGGRGMARRRDGHGRAQAVHRRDARAHDRDAAAAPARGSRGEPHLQLAPAPVHQPDDDAAIDAAVLDQLRQLRGERKGRVRQARARALCRACTGSHRADPRRRAGGRCRRVRARRACAEVDELQCRSAADGGARGRDRRPGQAAGARSRRRDAGRASIPLSRARSTRSAASPSCPA